MRKFFKFILVGMSNVIPGICSASTSIILGVYKDLLSMISNVFSIRYLKKYFLFYVAILLGVVIGIFGISYLYDIIPFVLNITFLGFVVRGFPHKFVELKRCSRLCYNILFMVGLVIILLFNLLNNYVIEVNYNSFSIKMVSLIAINGIFTSLAMILPGISGALLLVVLGLYSPLVDGISSILHAITSFNFSNIDNLNLIIVFSISFILGLIVSSKCINKLIEKKNCYFEPIINGLMLGSMINIFIILYNMEYYLYERIIGIIIFLIVIIFRKNK